GAQVLHAGDDRHHGHLGRRCGGARGRGRIAGTGCQGARQEQCAGGAPRRGRGVGRGRQGGRRALRGRRGSHRWQMRPEGKFWMANGWLGGQPKATAGTTSALQAMGVPVEHAGAPKVPEEVKCKDVGRRGNTSVGGRLAAQSRGEAISPVTQRKARSRWSGVNTSYETYGSKALS